VLAKNAFFHEIATIGHSRSFILHSFGGRQGVAYRHLAPSLPRFPLEFRAEVNHEETRVMGLSYSEDPIIVA